MTFHVVTIFPEFFRGPFEHGVIQRAQKALGIVAVKEGLKGGWIWRLPRPSQPEDRQETPKTATQIDWQPSHFSGGVGGLRGDEPLQLEVEI